MNKIKVLYIALLFAITATAQDYTHSLKDISWVKIESSSNVIVKTHDSDELLIKTSGNNEKPKRAKGLKLVGNGGVDNTDVGYSVIKEGNNLIVRNLKKSRTAKIYLPASQNISIVTNWNSGINIDGFRGEIVAISKLNGGVRMSDVSGPLTVNSLNGGVKIQFSEISQASPTTIYSTNGGVDITLPEKTPADLRLSTVNGSIYTNFDLKVPEKNGLKSISTKKVKGTINNGGVNIQLKATNGDIYLRKE